MIALLLFLCHPFEWYIMKLRLLNWIQWHEIRREVSCWCKGNINMTLLGAARSFIFLQIFLIPQVEVGPGRAGKNHLMGSWSWWKSTSESVRSSRPLPSHLVRFLLRSVYQVICLSQPFPGVNLVGLPNYLRSWA